MRTVVVVIGAVLVAFVLVAFFRGLTKIERNQNSPPGDGLAGG
jgi:hypothetical protein